MLRLVCSGLLATVGLFSWAAPESAAGEFAARWINQQPETIASEPAGEFLSWIKLLLVAVVFLIWVRLADWINRDSMKIGARTEMSPKAWNPITVSSFLIGFLVVLFVPIFYAGFSVYILSALTPFLVYFFVRLGKLRAEPDIRQQLKSKPGDAPPPPPLPQDEGAAIEFTPAGSNKKERQVNLIRARQAVGFPQLKNLIAETLTKRADQVLMDYSRDQVSCRFQVDGAWHPLPPMDRQLGDGILVGLKSLSGLNPAERRAKQQGRFSVKTDAEKANLEVLTQGVPTGERVQLKFVRKRKSVMTLGQLGMFPEMIEVLKGSLNKPGLAIISAPAGEGLTTSWQGALMTTDRMTRDCVAIVEEHETDTIVENIMIRRYDLQAGKKQFEATKATLLTQPHFVAVPTVEDGDMMDLLTYQVIANDRSILLRSPAKSAADALLILYSQAGNRDQFANAIKHVTGQRLIRRLCDQCRQEARVPPNTIQQLGGDPKKQATIFNQYQLPPPEQRVDAKGNPIEFPPCPTCSGIGYIGRIAVFELIEMNDQLRGLLRKSPSAEAIESAAQKAGKIPTIKQAYKLVLLGVTSLAEVQRVFKPK